MPKRRLKKVPRDAQPSDWKARLEKRLSKCLKAELIATLVELAEDPSVRRQVTAILKLEPSAEELVAATHIAIVDATDFDDRELNDKERLRP